MFPGNTVDVSTVEQVKADLKGWQLSRCVCVGDAGMVSQANLQDAVARRRQVHRLHADAPRR